MIHHLSSNRGRSHEDSRVVDFHHLHHIFHLVLGRCRHLLDPCGGDQAIQAAMLASDPADDPVKIFGIPNVDTVVMKRSTEIRVCAFLCSLELLVRFSESVKAVYWRRKKVSWLQATLIGSCIVYLPRLLQ